VGGSIGLGHTLLRTAVESAHEQQPLTLDGNVWIVADGRIDGRRELIVALEPDDQRRLASVPDVELILRAYLAWGDACVDRLVGDFVFAIWDSQRRRLFCARDHFGMRPFFYAQVRRSFIFSNTLDCLRLYPGVSDRLNDLAIADFLVLDNNQDLGTSAFADILRLPPAHTLTCSETCNIHRYWTLPEVEPVEYRRPQDCLDRFREVFDAAVSDRLRDTSAGILLSGGLDSPTVAASAVRVLRQRNSAFSFRAITHYHEHLIPHNERHYAGLVAKALGLPIEFLNGDNCRVFDPYDDPRYKTPEPNHFPMGFRNANPFVNIAKESRTALTGFGGDPALASLLSRHFRGLFNTKRYGRIVRDATAFLTAEGRCSRLYVRTRLRRVRSWFDTKQNKLEAIPAWLNPDFVERFELRERYRTVLARQAAPNNSARPEAYRSITAPYWTWNFEPYDCGITGLNVEVCHPFFDLRVLNLLLALPAVPWCSDKELLRRDARGVLPEAVRLRRKTPLMQDPICALFQKHESAWVDQFEPVPQLSQYIQRERIPRLYRISSDCDAWTHSKPISLNLWLERLSLNHLASRDALQKEQPSFVSVPAMTASS
jgi:asparagine synthase (glutamine-hydrolysing)